LADTKLKAAGWKQLQHDGC